MRVLGQAQDWRGVLAVSEQLLGLDASAADVDGLATMAREEVRRADEAARAAEVAARRRTRRRAAARAADERDRKISVLQRMMRRAARKREWETVLRTSGALARIDPALAESMGSRRKRCKRCKPKSRRLFRKQDQEGPRRELGDRDSDDGALVIRLVYPRRRDSELGESEEALQRDDASRGDGAVSIFFGLVVMLGGILLGIWLRRRISGAGHRSNCTHADRRVSDREWRLRARQG